MSSYNGRGYACCQQTNYLAEQFFESKAGQPKRAQEDSPPHAPNPLCQQQWPIGQTDCKVDI